MIIPCRHDIPVVKGMVHIGKTSFMQRFGNLLYGIDWGRLTAEYRYGFPFNF